MKIKSVKIEGMNNVSSREYTFQDANCFIGPNGSGKTTAMQAIQLALLGYTSSSGKQISGIMRHSNNHTMAVTAVLEDKGKDVTVQRIFTRSGKSNKSVLNISPDGYGIDEFVKELELPIFNFSELMSDTANSQKSWWMKFLPPCSTSVDWKKEFNKATDTAIIYQKEDILEDILGNMRTSGVQDSGIHAVQDANAFLKAELSAEKKTAQQLEDTLRSLVHYDDVEDNVSVESLKAEIAQLRKEQMNLTKYTASQKSYKLQRESIDAQISELSAKLQSDEALMDMKFALQKQRSDLVKSNEALTSLKERKMKVSAELDALRKMKSASMCPVLKISCDKLGDVSEDADAQEEQLMTEYQAIQNQLDKDEPRYSEELTKYNTASEQFNEACSVKSRVETLMQTELNPPELEDMEMLQCKSEEEYEAKLQEMQDILQKVIANQSYSELYDKVKNDTLISQSRIALLKLLISRTDVNSLQNELMSGQFVNFEAQMLPFIQTVMGENAAPKFHLTEKSSDFSFGMQKNSTYIPYSMLSSGEKCAFALAMMVAIVSMTSSELKLVMVDDMLDHLDSAKLKSVIQMIKSVKDVQFIFAGVVDISEKDINIIHV